MSRTLHCAAIALCVLLLATVSCQAAQQLAAQDDFNDNAMSPMWGLFIDGIGPVAQETNGWVEVTLPADTHEADSPHSFGGGYKSKQCLRGDFDIKIDYFLLDWPRANGVRVGLELFPDTGGIRMGNVQRASFGREVSTPAELYAADYQGTGGAVPTDHQSGSLRLTRVGSTLISGVLVDGQWIELCSDEFSAKNYYVAFTAWSHNYAFADKQVKVAFDNFAMLYGEWVDPGAPMADASQVPLISVEPAISAAPNVVSQVTALRDSELVKLPRGRPYFRMERLSSRSVPAKCGPYSRLKMSLPPGTAGVKR